ARKHVYVPRERLGDRAVLLRSLSRFLEDDAVDPVDLATDRQFYRRHPEALADLLERRRGLALDLRCRGSCLGEAMRERHRDARGMRRRDQLFRTGVLVGLFGARAPRDRRVVEYPAVWRDRSGATHEVAFPDRVCAALNRHRPPPSPRLNRTADSTAGPSARR